MVISHNTMDLSSHKRSKIEMKTGRFVPGKVKKGGKQSRQPQIQ